MKKGEVQALNPLWKLACLTNPGESNLGYVYLPKVSYWRVYSDKRAPIKGPSSKEGIRSFISSGEPPGYKVETEATGLTHTCHNRFFPYSSPKRRPREEIRLGMAP